MLAHFGTVLLFAHLIIFLFIAMALSAATSAKILAIAASVYAVLQVLKKIFPSLGGGWALALNIGLSILGFLVTVPSSDLLSVGTLTGLLMAVTASAGIHGTVKNMTSDKPAPTNAAA